MAAIELCWDLHDNATTIVEQVEDVLHEVYHLPVQKLGTFSVSADACDAARKQHLAGDVLKQVKALSPPGACCLAVVDVDLYAPGLNFVFGQADQLDLAAVVSLYRLQGEKVLPRTRTEVVHEVGHLLGLRHCRRPECVMFFSNTVYDTDRKGERLCSECQGRLHGRL